MASILYQSGIQNILNRTIDYLSGTIKCLLSRDTYTPDQDHDFVSDVTEIAAVTNYATGFAGSGRVTLGSKAISIDDANNRVRLAAADAVYGALGTGTTIGGYVVYWHNTSDADSRLISCRELAADVPTNGAQITAELATLDVARINC
jgi:hypothetical protein